MRYDFHPEARTEYFEAIAYYDGRQLGLGARFTIEIEAAIQRILESPTAWRVIQDDVRRCLSRKFPYGVLYTVEPDSVLILAIMHCSRRPGYWQARLRQVAN